MQTLHSRDLRKEAQERPSSSKSVQYPECETSLGILGWVRLGARGCRRRLLRLQSTKISGPYLQDEVTFISFIENRIIKERYFVQTDIESLGNTAIAWSKGMYYAAGPVESYPGPIRNVPNGFMTW